MKSQNQMICEYVAAHPLCYTKDVANALGYWSEDMSKRMNILENSDHLRSIKDGRLNRWILGNNNRFNPGSGNFNAIGNGGGRYYPTTGHINRKRVVTMAATAQDALALLSSGYSKVKVV